MLRHKKTLVPVTDWPSVVASAQRRRSLDGKTPVLNLPEPKFDDKEAKLYAQLKADPWRTIERYRDEWEEYPWPLLAIVDDPSVDWEVRGAAFKQLAKRSDILIPLYPRDWERATRELDEIAELGSKTRTAAYREAMGHCGALTIWQHPHLFGRELDEEIRRENKRYLNADKPSRKQLLRAFMEIPWSRFEGTSQASGSSDGGFNRRSPMGDRVADSRSIEEYVEEERQAREAQIHIERRVQAQQWWFNFLKAHLSPKQYAALEKQRTSNDALTEPERQLVSRSRTKIAGLLEEHWDDFEPHSFYLDVTFWLPKSQSK